MADKMWTTREESRVGEKCFIDPSSNAQAETEETSIQVGAAVVGWMP